MFLNDFNPSKINEIDFISELAKQCSHVQLINVQINLKFNLLALLFS